MHVFWASTKGHHYFGTINKSPSGFSGVGEFSQLVLNNGFFTIHLDTNNYFCDSRQRMTPLSSEVSIRFYI